MKLKALAAALLALFVGSCSCLVPLAAAAAAQEHACCAGQEASAPDCCLRAALPSAPAASLPVFQVEGPASAILAAPRLSDLLDASVSDSPPGEPCVRNGSSRAPPARA